MPSIHRLIARFAFLLLLAAVPVASAQQTKGGRVIALEQAYDIALASDQSIQIAAIEIRKANLLPWGALTRLGPQLNGALLYDRSQNTIFNNVAGTSNNEARSAGINFKQTLIDFSVPPAYQFGKLSALAARLQYRLTIRQTLFGVAQAYYNVLKDQSTVAINQQTLDLSSQQLDLAQTRYDLGAAARVDVSRAKATLEGARNILIQSQNTLAVDRNTLGNILNLGGDTGFAVTEPQDAAVRDEPFPSVLSEAYAHREDFKIAKIAIDQDIARRNEVAGTYAPSVSASAGQAWRDPTLSSNSRSWDASLSVQMPFLTGGQREIDLRDANHQISEARLQLETTAKSIQQEVKNAWLQVRSLKEAIVASRAGVDANVQNYNDVESQYQSGAATSLDVQVALRDLNNSRTLLSSQTYDYQIALRDLQRVQGKFQQERIEKAK